MSEELRLTDLNPKYFGFGSATTSKVQLGMTFQCPHCSKRLAVNFLNPIDPDDKMKYTTWLPPRMAWQRHGEDFSSMSLAPSIDFSGHGHAHFSIINGKVLLS